jgi:hypothetical protein
VTKYVSCEIHYEDWEKFMGSAPTLRDIIFWFRTGDQYEGAPLILDRETPHGYWMERKKMRALQMDEWNTCPYCGKPCFFRHWARMETLSGHFDGVHRQYHIRCKAKAKETV